MKKILTKLAVCMAVFVFTLIISSKIYNHVNEEKTTSMSSATLPLVGINTNGISYNTLRGFRQEPDGRFLRETVTPLGENRTLNFVIDKYGNDINKIEFEVRSIDGERLVERTRVNNYTENAEQIRAEVTIKDLIESDTEYNWILILNVNNETVRFCTRIIYGEDYHTYEKLSFVRSFHEKTYDKELAKELVMYLESNSRGDNTTLSRVDIHSSLKQVTWGGLKIKELGSPEIIINEMDAATSSITLNYRVKASKNVYNIVEYFRIRYTPNRIYLLDYERTMNQLFEFDASVYSGNKIMLGIRDYNVQMKESEGGSNLAFVCENRLFCYHAADKKLSAVFGFEEGDADKGYDMRSVYNNHEIKILSVDETGNVRFIVYGYMNRGSHEGSMGIQVCEYNGMMNTTEELVFIPYDKSFAVLRSDMEELSYISNSNIFYFYLDGSIMAVDLIGHGYEEIAGGLQQDSFKVSDSDKMVVWQNSSDSYDCTSLTLMNLNNGRRREIVRTANADRLLPIGFINEDLIYGIARYDDIVTDFTGAVTFPMYAICIQDEEGKTLKSYRPDDMYVTSAIIEDNLITLKRVEKNENGLGYAAVADDQIVNNVPEDSGYNSTEVVATENYENIVQIVLKNSTESKNVKYTKPKEILFEGSRDIMISVAEPVERYYVYGKSGILGTYSRVADAINRAYSENGSVVGSDGGYIWKKTQRSVKNQIMAITGKKADEESGKLAACIEAILEFNGIVKNVQPLLDRGDTVEKILRETLSDSVMLELQGVSLDAVLYYVNMDIPVLASLNDTGAVLITGFNEMNIVIMDPESGTVYKKGINDSVQWFQENGNVFLTYLKN